MGLKDLQDADSRGRWWIVGSAWSGKDGGDGGRSTGEAAAPLEASYSAELLEKARLMRMNTDARRAIFCTVMSADDYLEAFERVLKLRTAGKQKEREVAFVALTCCVQERVFNPYYAELCGRLCGHDRKYRLAVQFALWDRVKAAEQLNKSQLSNLAGLTAALINKGALPLSALKVVEFAAMDKPRVAFLRRTMTGLLGTDSATRKTVFSSVAASPKLATVREGLRLFLRHFMLKKNKGDKVLANAVEEAEEAMMAETRLRL